MKIIKGRSYQECVSYLRVFDYVDCPGAGFSFECDEKGNVDEGKLKPEALATYRRCINGEVAVVDKGMMTFRHTYCEPAIGLCNRCGEEVALDGFTNTCDCGADYNMSGQELAPREQWGEETGETASDVLMGGFELGDW